MSIAAGYMSAIKGFEGFTPAAKWDYAQHTNGYGTKALFPGEKISAAEAEQRFRSEITRAADLVESFEPNLDPGTKAALTSLTFNAGTRWMQSGLGQAVKDGDLDAARRIFVQYTKAGGEDLPGLVARRAAEVRWIGAHDAPPAIGTTTRVASPGHLQEPVGQGPRGPHVAPDIAATVRGHSPSRPSASIVAQLLLLGLLQESELNAEPAAHADVG